MAAIAEKNLTNLQAANVQQINAQLTNVQEKNLQPTNVQPTNVQQKKLAKIPATPKKMLITKAQKTKANNPFHI